MKWRFRFAEAADAAFSLFRFSRRRAARPVVDDDDVGGLVVPPVVVVAD
jgi:hypothetical protein